MNDLVMMLFNIVITLATFGLIVFIVAVDIGIIVLMFNILTKCPDIKKRRDKNNEKMQLWQKNGACKVRR